MTNNEDEELSLPNKDIIEFDQPSKILGWSLAVSDKVNNNNCLIAISCITEGDMFISKETEDMISKKRNSNQYFKKLFNQHKDDKDKDNKDLDEQIQFSRIPSEGKTKVFIFSFSDNRIIRNHPGDGIVESKIVGGGVVGGGIVGFLNNDEMLVCMNFKGIQKLNIEYNNENSIALHEDDCLLLPERLFKELKNINDAKVNWKYLSKSKYKNFLMTDTGDNHRQIQTIEIYDINTSQLVNIFHRDHRRKDFSISRNNEPGIFVISSDFRLFAYSYRDNIIGIYLMESGLEVVSKKFRDDFKIKFLEFIENERLFIIEKDLNDEFNYRIWNLSGSLNEYLTFRNESINKLENYDLIAKVDGNITYLDDDKMKFIYKKTKMNNEMVFNENDLANKTYEQNKRYNLEPWKNKEFQPFIRILTRRILLIIGQNSIQVWSSKPDSFELLNLLLIILKMTILKLLL